MSEIDNCVDRQGLPLRVGDEVRILEVVIDPDVDDEDREMFECMVGSTGEIERFDNDGLAWVTMWWSTLDGTATTSVGLAPRQMEKVVSSDSPAT